MRHDHCFLKLPTKICFLSVAVPFIHSYKGTLIHAGYGVSCVSGYAVLEERELPEDLTVEGAAYLGPKLSLAAINN